MLPDQAPYLACRFVLVGVVLLVGGVLNHTPTGKARPVLRGARASAMATQTVRSTGRSHPIQVCSTARTYC